MAYFFFNRLAATLFLASFLRRFGNLVAGFLGVLPLCLMDGLLSFNSHFSRLADAPCGRLEALPESRGA